MIGRHSTAHSFEKYAVAMFRKRKPMTLTAVSEDGILDTFQFRVEECFSRPHFWVNVSDETGRWVRIDAEDDKVYFVTFPA